VRREPAATSRRLAWRVAGGEAGRRVVDVVGLRLQQALAVSLARARVRSLVARGRVRVDGELVRGAGRPLAVGQRVEVELGPHDLLSRAAAADRAFVLTEERVLYRDAALLGVDKPPGLPMHPTADPRRPSLSVEVRRFLGGAGPPPYLAVHQRLDRDTSGVVLFAVDPRANRGLARAFAGREVEKTYVALTARPGRLPAARFRVAVPLLEDGRGRVRVGVAGGRAAETDVRVVEVLGRALLVEARPRTGRKHQVRAHLAHAGLPILGDRVYGPGGPGAARLMLHARSLSLPHPLTGEPLVVLSPLPADMVNALSRLREAGERRRDVRAEETPPARRGRRSSRGRGGSGERGRRAGR
jgi:23S rRNA pseudouridine1911/1915/1917 synthase